MTAESVILRAIQELHSEGDWVGFAGINRKASEIDPSLSKDDIENAIETLEDKDKIERTYERPGWSPRFWLTFLGTLRGTV